MPLRRRSKARVLALQALCAFDALADDFNEDLDAFLQDPATYMDLGWEPMVESEVLRFARELATNTFQLRERLDDLLTRHVPDWSVARMQPVDRNILRLGLYELQECPDTPFQVVINEAIELARRFGGGESPAFVNGVLDGVRRALERPPAPTAEEDAEEAAETATPACPAPETTETPAPEEHHGSV